MKTEEKWLNLVSVLSGEDQKCSKVDQENQPKTQLLDKFTCFYLIPNNKTTGTMITVRRKRKAKAGEHLCLLV